MEYYKRAIKQAEKFKGKIKVESKVKVRDKEDLSIAYTPGVAGVSLEIAKERSKAQDLTIKGNSIAVVSDGSAVLGLGDIGPEAALPVMEGKCLLFKEFAGIDAYPIVLGTKDVETIVSVVKSIAPGFSGINLEDISAPRCFKIEEKLQDIGIPVFHDDQHGTAIVVLAALANALKVVGKKMGEVRIIVFGAGAAGIAISKIVRPKELVLVDSKGPVNSNRLDINTYKKQVASHKNYFQVKDLEQAFKGADIFIGVSGKGKVDADLIRLMNQDAIVFAMSNPDPEIMPEEAKKAGASVVATGRSDYPNQINNVLAFPGVFRGLLNSHTKKVTEEMKQASAKALASVVKEPSANKIIPDPFDKNVVSAISKTIMNK